eukprot:TRINITY_DN3663_c0_g1_i1.p1 TRINITY_DN3663_c0_g1~~TRINITY_DN3663_c0_g1_i1.p1  ORF type:complete len:521 (+),score=88.17 TRINITY_DN3663_c0_g1_i1:48-1565(+)
MSTVIKLIAVALSSATLFGWFFLKSAPLDENWHGCFDQDGTSGCEDLVHQGYCKSQKQDMELRCKKSCGFCGHKINCKDNHDNCKGWADAGECQNNAMYMVQNCALSCGTCVSCIALISSSIRDKLSIDTSSPNGITFNSESYSLWKDHEGHWVLASLKGGDGGRQLIRSGIPLPTPYSEAGIGLWMSSTKAGWVTDEQIAFEEAEHCGSRPLKRFPLPKQVQDFAANPSKPIDGRDYLSTYDIYKLKPIPDSQKYPSGPRAFTYPEDRPKEDMLDIPYYIVSHEPKTYFFPRFLSDDEADRIRNVAEKKVTRSLVVPTGGKKAHGMDDVRTSSGCWLDNRHDGVEVLRTRVLQFTGFSKNQTEKLQILRYGPGQKYNSHHDYYSAHGATTKEEELEMWRNKWNNNWNRAVTFFIYLEDTEEGGETVLPRANGGDPVWNMTDCSIGFRALPRKGAAMAFYDMRPDFSQDEYSLHGGCPVKKGLKWGAVQWLHVKVRDEGNEGDGW